MAPVALLPTAAHHTQDDNHSQTHGADSGRGSRRPPPPCPEQAVRSCPGLQSSPHITDATTSSHPARYPRSRSLPESEPVERPVLENVHPSTGQSTGSGLAVRTEMVSRHSMGRRGGEHVDDAPGMMVALPQPCY